MLEVMCAARGVYMTDQSDSAKGIGLPEFIKGLRGDLIKSMALASGETLQFALSKLDVELQITAEWSKEAEGKIDFKVISFGGGGKVEGSSVQTVKLSLTPMIGGKAVDALISTGEQNIPDR
jgi:hypothetical protein